MREKQQGKQMKKEQNNKMNETSNPLKDTHIQQPSAADIMLMQAQGKEIPDRKPVQANIQKNARNRYGNQQRCRGEKKSV